MGVLTFLPQFLVDQIFRTPACPTRNFKGETIIITGSNTGLGKEAARHVVHLGADKVILAVRTVSKGEEAKRDIEKSTGRTGVIDIWQLDLSSYDSTKAFAKRVESLSRIDAIVENAGVATTKYQRAENNEHTITVNVISTFLLMYLLIPKLRAVAKQHGIKPRLSILVSEMFQVAALKARNASRILDEMNNEKTADMNGRYADSKALEVAYLQQFLGERKVKDAHRDDVIINYVNPGWCYSDLVREGFPTVGKIVMKLVARSTEEGSRTLVAAAGSSLQSNGQYQNNGYNKDISNTWVNTKAGMEVCEKVYAEVNEQLERIQPGVTLIF